MLINLTSFTEDFSVYIKGWLWNSCKSYGNYSVIHLDKRNNFLKKKAHAKTHIFIWGLIHNSKNGNHLNVHQMMDEIFRISKFLTF